MKLSAPALALACCLTVAACDEDPPAKDATDSATETTDAATETVEPETVEDTVAPDTLEPETVEDTVAPDTVEPETVEDTIAPDTVEPETVEDTVAPEIEEEVGPTCPTVLLEGGVDIVEQGWSLASSGAHEITYGDDYVRIATSTVAGQNTSGHALLHLDGAVQAGVPFELTFEVQVESVSRHNTADAGAGILGAFTPTFGMPDERMQMIYLDAAAIGWADDSQSAAAAIVDDARHIIVLAVDAAGTGTVTFDGAVVLTRANYVVNGRIAIGDQTNDANVDGVMRIFSVTKACPPL